MVMEALAIDSPQPARYDRRIVAAEFVMVMFPGVLAIVMPVPAVNLLGV